VLEAMSFLAKDDPELSAVVLQHLKDEGVELRAGAKIARVDGTAVILDGGERLDGSHLLVATGRTPTVDGLDLDTAGIGHTPRGITVDGALRTTNRGVWAIGDCNGLYAFTHMAGYEASLFIRGALFRAPARLDHSIVPWTTYTDPELAQVGLSEHTAREKHGDGIKVVRWRFADNDRARTERVNDGLVKAIADRRGRILGATIVGPNAGELIQPWCLALSQRLKMSALASFVPPYPTLGEASKRAAGSYFTEALFGARTRKLVRFLARLPVW
jgi:pyruvate/2-oxoglutarate dehydrogenase complex dihydrolipoamide dehydrogenase (E3) component